MKQTLICITCPLGCEMTVERNGDAVAVTGNSCKRGETYAVSEITDPRRTLTATVRIARENAVYSGTLFPGVPDDAVRTVAVRSDHPIPRDMQLPCMEMLRTLTVDAPVKRYDVIVPDILGTGCNIVATGTCE